MNPLERESVGQELQHRREFKGFGPSSAEEALEAGLHPRAYSRQPPPPVHYNYPLPPQNESSNQIQSALQKETGPELLAQRRLDYERERQEIHHEFGTMAESERPDLASLSMASFSDLLQEARILQQGVQVLFAFLIILPFQTRFPEVPTSSQYVYVLTFGLAAISLLLLSSPAAQHRVARPLLNRVRFKIIASRYIVAGLFPLSLSLALASYLAVEMALGWIAGLVVGILVGVLSLVLWFIWPYAKRKTL